MVRIRFRLISVFALCILISFALWSHGQEPQKPAAEGFVESIVPEACQVCHPAIYQAFQKENPHWTNSKARGAAPDRKGCESCHGPGEKHINSGGSKELIFTFKDQKTRVNSDACLKCHKKQKDFFQFQRGAHKLATVGCNDCHRMHGNPALPSLLKAKEIDLCFSCHGEVKSRFLLPTRHRVLEGAMRCSDCHTPHGSRTRPSLKRWNKFNIDVCFKCHPEKRGPWVFEHPSVKYEGCAACHDPHGSPNRFLLAHRDVRRVCIQCHGQRHLGDFLSSTEVCINCHTQIHGSNFSSRFFR